MKKKKKKILKKIDKDICDLIDLHLSRKKKILKAAKKNTDMFKGDAK